MKSNHYSYRLCDQRIPCLQGCLGELATYIGDVLQCRRARDSHNHRDPLAFRLGSEAEVSVFEQIHRIKKSQARNCDTCSELE